MYPLLDALPTLDEVHRRAIAVICGLEPGPPPTQLIAGAATLALVTHAATTMPLLVIIDDVPWLDLASAMAFAYLARRLRDAAVRLIVAARSELENVFVRSGFDAHILKPLSEESADSLLVDHFPALSANVRMRIREEALGNPLALLDLPAALEGDPRPLTDHLPAHRTPGCALRWATSRSAPGHARGAAVRRARRRGEQHDDRELHADA